MDAREAEAALRGGASILDLKDPRRGALGAPPAAALRAVVRLRDRMAPGVPVSAALGRASDRRAAARAATAAALGCDYVKTSLEGLKDEARAVAALARITRAVRDGGWPTHLVAAGFADAAAVLAPDPRRLPAIAAAAGYDGCLLDTAVKDGRGLFLHLPAAVVAAFARACRERGLLCALAGSLGPADLAAAVACGADLIGARGALCDGGRTGRLEEERVRRFREALRHNGSRSHTEPASGMNSANSGSTSPRRARRRAATRSATGSAIPGTLLKR
jgi:uncharacterized protein (UPF0264 family)